MSEETKSVFVDAIAEHGHCVQSAERPGGHVRRLKTARRARLHGLAEKIRNHLGRDNKPVSLFFEGAKWCVGCHAVVAEVDELTDDGGSGRGVAVAGVLVAHFVALVAAFLVLKFEMDVGGRLEVRLRGGVWQPALQLKRSS